MSTKKNSIDMLHGPLPGKIILFAIPLALSSILQQLFNSADSIVAGRFIGPTALAAVGGVAPVITLLIGLFVGLSIGSNVAIAIHIGHGELDRVKGAVQTTAVVTLVSSVALTAVGVLVTEPVLDAISVPADARAEAAGYLQAYFAGIAFFMIYNFGSAVLRAKGDTRRPLYALAVAVLLNIVLNLVAVMVFNGGVVGIALATDVSNAAAAGIIVWFPDDAKAGGARVVATGRSDFPNQINNVLAFPGIFRGAFDVRAKDINDEMKLAASHALAELITDEELSEDYIIPKAFDPRVGKAVAAAVADAARKTGVARL